MGRSPDPKAAARQRANLLPGVSPDPKAAARQRANLQRGRLDGAGDNGGQSLEPLRQQALEIERVRYRGKLDPDDGRLHSLADRKARWASATAWLDEMGRTYGLGVVRDRKGNVFPVVDRVEKWRNGIDRLEAEIRAELREAAEDPGERLRGIEARIVAERESKAQLSPPRNGDGELDGEQLEADASDGGADDE